MMKDMTGSCSFWWAVVLLFLFDFPKYVEAQTDDGFWTVSGDGFIYMLLMGFFGFNFLVPPIRLIYEKFLKGFINQATEKVMEIQAQIIERMNDAQRKVSDRMTAV
jgi:hypothetical protein